ncbi:MAG TPA: histidine kinase [Gemmatimonadaceae bacterium]|nr:histidine kinase [Gemmatimonadaceae bacterium]
MIAPASANKDALPPLQPRRPPLLVIFGVWSLFGLWLAEQSLLTSITAGRPIESWSRPFITSMLGAWFWASVTPVLMWNTRRIRDRVPLRGARVAQHALSLVVVHVVDVTVYTTIMSLISSEPTRPFIQLLASLASFNAMSYVIVVVVTAALDYHDAYRERGLRAAQLEAHLALAQFHALRAQLHPHFLFNSLNAISALMHKDVGRADRMLAKLSELLRVAIDTSSTPEIRLIDEIEFVERYLEIEQMRFGNRLHVRVDLPAETYNALVPTMLLQPLVENAVRHGVAPHPGPGRVEIRAERNGGELGITVRDTGNGMTDETNGDRREGVGLRTTRARLAKLYGDAQELSLMNVPGGFETRVTLPFHRREEAPDEDSLSHRR